MSTSSIFTGNMPEVVSTQAKPAKTGPGFWARALLAITKARELQAKRETNRFLARQPDRFLRDIGLDDTEIAELRRQDQF